MVSITELRIGNIVKDKYGKFITVNDIVNVSETEQGINGNCEDNNMPDLYCKDIFGIDITNNILLKCGFKKEENVDGYFIIEYGIISIIIAKGLEKKWLVKYREYIGSPYMTFCINTPMDYLHQLQNLYYCLTGDYLQYVED